MVVNISYEIERLVNYSLKKGLIKDEDVVFAKNSIAMVLGLEEIDECTVEEDIEAPADILENMTEWAVNNGMIDDSTGCRDLFDTKIMGCLVPRPSEVIREFNSLYKKDERLATDYFYNINRASNYIRTDRIKKDLKWETKTEYGDIEITINLSKPEKDPKDIAAAKNSSQSSYPKCVLCRENEGYSGRINHPARQNLRLMPVKLNGEEWYLQYSPYVYYDEHCIVLKGKHEPMKISKDTFIRLLDFVDMFPHYFIGSNAGLPIVGGSILSHDHFQGGRHEFAMAKAGTEETYAIKSFNGITLSKVKWPMSVLRLEGSIKEDVVAAGNYIYEAWKDYSDEGVDIICSTKGVPHNTVTPIARKKNGRFQLDLVLRNNRTSNKYPDGIFHPHRELHHIKKENIGLIEVLGLAVLPGRLVNELKELSYYIVNRSRIEELNDRENLLKHKEWCLEIINSYSDINEKNVEEIMQKEVGLRFLKVLEDAGVYKRDKRGQEAFDKFINTL